MYLLSSSLSYGALAVRTMLAAAAACTVLLPLSSAQAQCAGRWLTSSAQMGNGGMDSDVLSAAVLPNGDTVVGGTFNSAGGVAATGIARWDGQWWTPLGEGLRDGITALDQGVLALLALPNGDIVAGGNFRLAGSVPVGFIARWNGTEWSSLGLGMNGIVRSLAMLPNGDLVAGGSFTTADGQAAAGIARWNGVVWSPLGTGPGGPNNPRVNALALLANGDLVAGGKFYSASGSLANILARWDGSTWTPLGGEVASGMVHALKVRANGDLIVGGEFVSIGGMSANRIARWDGVSWSPLGSGMLGSSAPRVRSLAELPNGHLVAGGNFTIAGGTNARYVARWDGVAWAPLGAGFADEVRALALESSDDLVVCGIFRAWNGVPDFNGIGRWNGTELQPIHSGLERSIITMQPRPNGDMIVGGVFNSGSGTLLNKIARWDGNSFSPLGTGVTSTVGLYWPTQVSSIAVLPNGDIVAGGVFTKAGDVNARHIARWDGTAWSPLGSGLAGVTSGGVDASALLDLTVLANGDVVAGGYFTTAGGVSANGIARWNGTAWSALGSGVTSSDGTAPYVSAIVELPDGGLVAGGYFRTAGGVSANLIARWDGTAWTALGSGIQGAYSWVNDIVRMPNGDLIVCGEFATAGGVTVNNIARWDGTAWSSLGSGTDLPVWALEVLPNGDLLAGGAFTEAGGVSASGIARWDGVSWSAFGGGLDGTQLPGSTGRTVGAVCFARLSSGELIVTGSFSSAGGTPCVNFARWSETGAPWVAQDPAPQSIDAGASLELSAACASGYDFDGAVAFQWQRNGVAISNGEGGASKGGGTVSGATGVLDAEGLSTTLSITGARPSDAGAYTVVFTNNCGDATAVAALVSIAAPCVADLTGDGEVDSRDMTVLLGDWGTAAGDLNADGTTNEQDLTVLLAAWGACR